MAGQLSQFGHPADQTAAEPVSHCLPSASQRTAADRVQNELRAAQAEAEADRAVAYEQRMVRNLYIAAVSLQLIEQASPGEVELADILSLPGMLDRQALDDIYWSHKDGDVLGGLARAVRYRPDEAEATLDCLCQRIHRTPASGKAYAAKQATFSYVMEKLTAGED